MDSPITLFPVEWSAGQLKLPMDQ